MSSGIRTSADRRQELIAESDRNRATLVAVVAGLEHKLAIVDRVVAGARRLRRHRGLLGAAAVALVLVPLAARKWVGHAIWWAPLALEAYRLVKKSDGKRARSPRGEPTPDPSPPA